MGCRKAQGFLEAHAVTVAERTNAKSTRHGRAEVLALARSAERIVVARGKKVVTFDMSTNPPDEATLLTHLLGPTGNLRAPAIRRGRTLLVGFHPDAYQELLQA